MRDQNGNARQGRRRRRGSRRRRERLSALGPEARRFRLATVVFVTILVIGFVGYQVLEGMGPLDAMYMTVITITTVGFGEVQDLDQVGRAFTIGLIVAGVSTVSYAALTAAEFVVEGHLRRIIERRRMERDIGALSGHIIICGFGRVGTHVAQEVDVDGADFVVVDVDEEKIQRLIELGYLHVRGDATEEHVLEDAGLARCRAVVAAVNSDADNVLVTLTVKGVNPGATVIARAKLDENEAKLRRAGADKVIAPTTIGGRRIAQILTRPAVADFLEGEGSGGVDYTLEEIPIRDGDDLDGVSLGQAAVRERFGCTVLAIRRADGTLDSHPNAADTLHAGDVLVVIGSNEEVGSMRSRFRDGPR